MTNFSTTSPDHEQPSTENAMADLARYLRQGVGQEWRAELEATEFETHQDRLRRRTLRDVTKMALHRGDRLTMQIGELQLTGEVAGGGKDYVTINTEHLCVDARLARIALRVTKRSAGGTEARGMAPTWRARLTEMELTQEVVEVYAPSLGNPRRGRIRVVAVDHLWLVDPAGFDSYLPIEEIAVVTRPLPTLKWPCALTARKSFESDSGPNTPDGT